MVINSSSKKSMRAADEKLIINELGPYTDVCTRQKSNNVWQFKRLFTQRHVFCGSNGCYYCVLVCVNSRCTVIIQLNFTKAGCTCTMYSILQCTIICGYY